MWRFCSVLLEAVDFYFRVTFYSNRAERSSQLLQQPEVITTTVEEVSSSARPLVRQLKELPNRIKKVIASLPDQEVGSSSFLRIKLHAQFNRFRLTLLGIYHSWMTRKPPSLTCSGYYLQVLYLSHYFKKFLEVNCLQHIRNVGFNITFQSITKLFV
jgi:hypothetical protein